MNKNTTHLNISSATANGAIANLKELNLDCSTSIDSVLDSWAPWTGSNRCPNCGSNKIEYNTQITLTTHPAQSQLRCKDCRHVFSSGFMAEWTNNDALNRLWEHDQSILGKPQVGDWPPSPQVGDAPLNIPQIDYPNLLDEIPPMYPEVVTPKKDMPIGWICPKCGRGLAPHVDSCPCYQSNNIKITY